MGVFFSDLRFGARQLLQRPGFAAVAIGSLALGIGLSVTISLGLAARSGFTGSSRIP
jgi:hypothetical protein